MGGCEIKLHIAVDLTCTNNDLHDLDPNKNHYIQAMQAVGGILAQYDHNQKIPLYGFGCNVEH
jgi:hypothetical protein